MLVSGGTLQCFDNITSGASINSNDYVNAYYDCETCNNDVNSCVSYRIQNYSGNYLNYHAYNCAGGYITGNVPPYTTSYTGCIIQGTLVCEGSPTITISGYC